MLLPVSCPIGNLPIDRTEKAMFSASQFLASLRQHVAPDLNGDADPETPPPSPSTSAESPPRSQTTDSDQRLPLFPPLPWWSHQPAVPTLPRGERFAIGALSSKYESAGRGPGTVSDGRGDPAGGASYGTYQLASRTGTLEQFLSTDGAPWAPTLRGHDPRVPGGEFARRWKAIAARTPQAFQAAQHAFIERTHYAPVVARVRQETAIDLTRRSSALQEAIWSTSVQHARAADLVVHAIRTLKQGRDDPVDDRALVESLYGLRADYVRRLGLPASTVAALRERYENERKDVLALLARAHESSSALPPRGPSR